MNFEANFNAHARGFLEKARQFLVEASHEFNTGLVNELITFNRVLTMLIVGCSTFLDVVLMI